MSSDRFANSIDWISRATDKEKKSDIGSVEAWQCVASTPKVGWSEVSKEERSP